MFRHRILTPLVLTAALALAGCGDSQKTSPQPNAQPVGEQKVGKDGKRALPAPPPIEKVN